VLSSTDTLSGWLVLAAALFTTERTRSIIARFVHPFVPFVRQVALSLCPSPRASVALSNLPTHDPKRISKLPGRLARCVVARRKSRASGTDDDGAGAAAASVGRSIGRDRQPTATVVRLTASWTVVAALRKRSSLQSRAV